MGLVSYDEGPSRTQVRTVECPACGAEPGELCRMDVRSTRRDGERKRNHMERVHVYTAKVDERAQRMF